MPKIRIGIVKSAIPRGNSSKIKKPKALPKPRIPKPVNKRPSDSPNTSSGKPKVPTQSELRAMPPPDPKTRIVHKTPRNAYDTKAQMKARHAWADAMERGDSYRLPPRRDGKQRKKPHKWL